MGHLTIIAELAQGFEGRPDQARLLLQAAASAGADAAKFQLVYADELATPDYQHYGLFRSLEMSDDQWAALAACAAETGIRLQVDIFGPRSLALAAGLGLSAVKLHPTDVTNRGLLAAVAGSPIPSVLLGAGGTSADELRTALTILTGKQVVVLLGFQGYPTPDASNQIARVRFLAQRIAEWHPSATVGFADHADPTQPQRIAFGAMAFGAGATHIEKHLTLGRGLRLEDHESALNPDEFAEFVATMRACASAFGTCTEQDDFGMSNEERQYRTMIRRHVVAARDLDAGTQLGPDDLVLKRTSVVDPCVDLDAVYGRTLRRAVSASEAIVASHLS